MKPKILKIQGLNSFQQQQIIDFGKLMERGVFGIFGDTGSGKSTILDAITLALYGDIARNSHTFINSDLDTANISFEFELNNNAETKIFVVERIYKRSKDNGCNCKSARIYEKGNNEIKNIEEGAKAVDKKVEELIGLKKYDFTRTIVLPQGKFSEFLTLTASQRNDMLERILHLEEYGKSLEEKIKCEKAAVNLEVEKLKSKMSVYNSINNDELLSLNNKQKTLNEAVTMLKESKLKLEEDVELEKEILKFQEEKMDYKLKYNTLLSDKENIELNRKNLLLAQKADTILPVINSLEENQEKLNFVDNQLNLKSKELITITHSLESIQQLYNKAKEFKDNNYKLLLEEESDLKQALELTNKVSVVEEDKKILDLQYNEAKIDYSYIKIQQQDIEDKLNISKEKLKSILIDKNQLIILPQYRQSIEEGYQFQIKFNDILISIKAVEQKINKYNISIEDSKEQILEFQNMLTQLEVDVLNCEKNLNDLNKSEYSNLDILLTLQNDGNQALLEYNEVKNIEDKKLLLEKELIYLNESLKDDKSNFEIQSQKVNNHMNGLDKLKEQLEAFKIINQSSILAQLLENNIPCPVCGSLEHPMPAKKIDDKIFNILNKKIDSLQLELSKQQKLIDKLNSNIEVNQKESKMLVEELSTLNKSLSGKTSEQLNKNLIELRQKFINTKQAIKKWEIEKVNLETQLQYKKDEKNKLNLENTRIIERKNKDNQIILELLPEKQNFVQEFETISKTLDKLKFDLSVENFEEERNMLLSKEKKYAQFVKKESDIREKIDLYDKQKDKIFVTIKDCENKILQISKSIKEKQNIIDNYNTDIDRLSKKHNPKEYMNIVKKKIEKLCLDVENLDNKLDASHKQYQKIADSCIDYNASKNTLTELLICQKKILKNKLEENNFKEIEEVKNSFIKKELQFEINKLIKNYDESYKNIVDNLKRIDDKLSGKIVNKDELKIKISNLFKITEQIENISSELAIINEKIITMETNLKELDKFSETKDILTHRLDLLEQLIKLITGKRFIQFISRKQMLYIAKEATKNLKRMTKDRYAIELDEDSNFIMRDDFLGSVKRRPETLSGGELFVTSLSLALALSTQIQLKSKTPIEFFFLDEGFGSLDVKLLDIVIESLERLHSAHMHVGIISHVEELKERISAKLIVDSAQYGISGSSVKLELS